ncbi:MAG TPA: alkaline phosphatase family protein [Candidatus Binataceae bacterium]|nr:alkaline phosphatase family protein [Candidatus Binataceae bacterium]
MKSTRHRRWISRVAIAAMLAAQSVPIAYAQPSGNFNDDHTRTPIKHVVLIIGENRTFDHLFATYVPPKGQTVWNLLSEGIVNPDGTPGVNAGKATQYTATDTTTFSINPAKGAAYTTLPSPNVGGPASAIFPSVTTAETIEPALPLADYYMLTIGGTGLSSGLDTRFLTGGPLPNDPFDITDFISYDDYAGSPVHRFFQMWQQLDCDATKTSSDNPSGCQEDLFPWVEVTVATGSNGNPEPTGFKGEGSIAMGYYNNQQFDVPYFTHLAREYALSDNYHQAVQGGTGANHLAIGYGTTIFYADSSGNPATPPSNQIENPDPQTSTNNFYTQDGYGGGSYVNCADTTQPGVSAVMDYLDALPYKPFNGGDCQKNAYYLVNNYNPGYLGDGTPAPLGPSDFTIPPTTQPNLALLLSDHHVSWKYYGEGWDNGKEDGEVYNGNGGFCNICDPFLYSTQVMTNPTLRANNQDITNLYSDIQAGTLPAVSIVKPDGFLDGHPASSKFELFEAFCHKIVDMMKANPSLWKDTAIMITVDEGGGYYDSGYVQPLDFFGDGTRIPLIVVSPYSTGGRVVHAYYDHVSFDKFVEANWHLPPISAYGRDNLPNPIALSSRPYFPTNSPAIGDLMEMFKFGSHDGSGEGGGSNGHSARHRKKA